LVEDGRLGGNVRKRVEMVHKKKISPLLQKQEKIAEEGVAKQNPSTGEKRGSGRKGKGGWGDLKGLSERRNRRLEGKKGDWRKVPNGSKPGAKEIKQKEKGGSGVFPEGSGQETIGEKESCGQEDKASKPVVGKKLRKKGEDRRPCFNGENSGARGSPVAVVVFQRNATGATS